MRRDFRKDWREYPATEIPSKGELPAFLFGLLKKGKVRTIVDLGCGVGKFAIDLYQRGYSVVGVDINPEAIEKAKTDAERIIEPCSDNFLRFYVGDIVDLQLEESPFDAVLMQLVISLIGNTDDRRKLIRTCRRLLKPGGILYFSASGVSDDINPKYAETYKKDFPMTGEMFTYFSRDSEGKVLYVTHHFTEEELKELLQTEFEEIKIAKKKESSSRRPNELAYFFYVTARARVEDSSEIS